MTVCRTGREPRSWPSMNILAMLRAELATMAWPLRVTWLQGVPAACSSTALRMASSLTSRQFLRSMIILMARHQVSASQPF